jgi:hypothetical protein
MHWRFRVDQVDIDCSEHDRSAIQPPRTVALDVGALTRPMKKITALPRILTARIKVLGSLQSIIWYQACSLFLSNPKKIIEELCLLPEGTFN